MTKINLGKLERDAIRVTLVDGLSDILVGVFLLVDAAFLRTNTALAGIWPLSLFGFALLYRWLAKRLVYPRVGYVELPAVSTRKSLVGFLGVFVSAVLIFLVAIWTSGDLPEPFLWYRWTPLLASLILLVPMSIYGFRTGYYRYFLYAILGVAGAILLSGQPYEARMEPIANWVLGMGCLFFSFGVGTFITFLRRNPLQEME